MAARYLYWLMSTMVITAYGQTYTDTYDTLGNAVAVGIPQITSYNGLLYNGWAVSSASPVTGTNGGVIAQSKPNTAIAVTTLTAATGNPGFISAGSGVQCFDLLSFYFACSLNTQQGVAGSATGCGINLSGYKYGGKSMLGSVAFNYDPGSNTLASPMRLADLSKRTDYRCLVNITLAVSTGTEALLEIDNLVHVNYRKAL